MLRSDILKVKLAEAEVGLDRLKRDAPNNNNIAVKIQQQEKDISSLKKQITDAEAAEASEREKLKGGQAVKPEDAEIAALREQVSVGKILKAAIEGTRLDGAEEEFRVAVHCNEKEIPLDAFVHKADTATPSPSTVGINFAPIVPAVFAVSVAPYLGITMPRVESGQYSVPRLTTNLTGAAKAKGGVTESSAAAFTVASAKPRRISARLSLRIEDLAEVGIAGFEAALRANLQEVLSDTLDTQLLTGNGTSPNISGLMNQLAAVTDPADVVDFASFASDMASGIDGKWAARLSDVKMLVNALVYRKLATSYQQPVIKKQGTADNFGGVGAQSILSAADWAEGNTGGLRCSSRMPDAASDISKCVLVRSGAMTTPMDAASMPAILPTWGNISVSDIYTDAGKGLQHLTLHVLVGNKVLIRQPDVFQEVRIKTA